MSTPSTARYLREAGVAVRLGGSIAEQQQKELFSALAQRPLGTPKQVLAYHDLLLFVEAYPSTSELHQLAQSELRRVTAHVHRRSRGRTLHEFEQSGIAGSLVRSSYSLGLNSWLSHRFGDQVELSAKGLEQEKVVATLNHLLDPVEYEMLHAGKTEWEHWSTILVGKGANSSAIKKWIVDMAERLPGSTAMREYVFSQFSLVTQWRTTPDVLSMSAGRAPVATLQIHHEGLIKRMTLKDAFAQQSPQRVTISAAQQRHLCDLAKGVLCMQLRETDPSTHAEVSETQYFDMGRGVSIALYAMKADMKMVLQSYIGFMVFKNGVPCAYGGGWLLNDDSGFGVNIFPPFRGGESAVVVCQLLRLYRKIFNVDTFNVDPYQIGYGNSDGITSGAFWFYYRLGFRPVERRFLRLATAEFKAMSDDPRYRSSAATLKILAESTMRYTLPGINRTTPITADAIGDVVTRYVNAHFNGDRQKAQQQALALIRKRSTLRVTSSHPVARIATLLTASGYVSAAKPAELRRFVRDYATKFKDESKYIRTSQTHPLLFQCLYQAEQQL